uniref:Reverse transcriptase domain-containing protein n=1 Tax=Tanacetum cinerariifolium TaxID=118510 RepID=A0A6L2KS08_TANCI|nr:reverse transcriptase domain-containing protein [Tanacetum cinerariifolium]
MLRACPHHGFSKLTKIDTFYNGLNEQDQDSLNAAAGGNLLSKTTREALKIIENKSKVRYSRSKSNVSRVNTNSRESSSKTDDRIDKLADQILNLVEIINKQVITPATAKAVEKTCVICGGGHAYYDCIATDSNQPSVCATTAGSSLAFCFTCSMATSQSMSLLSSSCNFLAYSSSISTYCFFFRGLGSFTIILLPLSLDLVSTEAAATLTGAVVIVAVGTYGSAAEIVILAAHKHQLLLEEDSLGSQQLVVELGVKVVVVAEMIVVECEMMTQKIGFVIQCP